MSVLNNKIRLKLEKMSEENIRKYSSKVMPNVGNVLGIRLPLLREYARELAETFGEKALDGEDIYFEEKMLRGMIIGYLKTDAEKRLEYIREFVPKIDSWGICDSFCSTLKFTNKNRCLVWEFIQPYAISEKEFEERFCAVMLLCYFVNEEYIDRTLELLKSINTKEYYSSMAVAWALAECYIKFPEKTLPYIEEKSFDSATHNRALRKIFDSYRVDGQKKEELKKLVIKI